ncbi:hypothetical protein, partial [Sporolactobacillus shoreae]|uniref:hypothetical protein n=1 Tax=Sporolactobacillus shoreae TaxID=1465501 RepID=UPI0019D611E5
FFMENAHLPTALPLGALSIPLTAIAVNGMDRKVICLQIFYSYGSQGVLKKEETPDPSVFPLTLPFPQAL